MSSSAANKLSGAEAAAAQPQQQQTQPPKRSWADIARRAAAPPAPAPAPAAPCAPAAAAPLAQPAEAEATEDVAPAEVAATAAAAAEARRPWVGLAQRMATALGSSSGGDSSSYDSDFDEADESEPESQPEDEPLDEPEPNEVQPEEELLDDDSVPKFVQDAPAKLKPGKRGVRKCLCQGEVLVMLGHYGWLASLCEIDHPDAQKNGGRIYFQRGDVAGGLQLVQGDGVEFFLYEDSRGLGAEDVRLRGVPVRPAHEAEEALRRPKAELCAGAAEFRPSGRASGGSAPDAAAQAARAMSASAVEFTSGFSAKAAEFVPGMSSGAAAFVPSKPAAQGLNVFAFNDAYLSDSDDEDSTIAGGSGSSSHGASSDSEPETPTASKKCLGAFPSPPLAPPPGLPIPHGLVLPGFRAPPGLSLA